jgi:hypothetical protein
VRFRCGVIRCQHVAIPCVHPHTRSPLRLLDPSRCRTLPELRHDQDRISSSSQVCIHDPADARVPHLLPELVADYCAGGGHDAAISACFVHRTEGRLDSHCCRWADCRSQPALIWATNPRSVDGESTSRYALVNTALMVPCLTDRRKRPGTRNSRLVTV